MLPIPLSFNARIKAYYNALRPHRGVRMANDVLDETFQP
jgi:hypothetical protein